MGMIPPANSKIAVSTDASGFITLKLPSSSSLIRYPIAAFLIFWLCGWFAGLIGVGHQLIADQHKAPEFFLIFWLGGWTVGGCFAIAMLYRILRPGIPECLTLSKPNLRYDSGVQPFDFSSFGYYRSRNNPWKKLLEKRKVMTFGPVEISTLRLRDTDNDNRLTIDSGNDRIDLGRSLTEVEREWLFAQLKTEYRL